MKKTKQTIDYYSDDKVIGEQRNQPPQLKRQRQEIALRELLTEVKILRQNGPKVIRVLDIGCGDGTFLSQLIKVEGEVKKKLIAGFGIDYSLGQLKLAQNKKIPGVELQQMDLNDGICFKSNFFDLIYAGEVIEHVLNPDFFLEEIYRIAKPRALLVISTPNLCCWVSRLSVLLGLYPMFYESSTKNSNYGFGFLKKIKKQDWPVGHLRVMNLLAVKDLFCHERFLINKIYGAEFGFTQKIIKYVDRFFTIFPSLASDLIVVAKVDK